MVNSKLIPTLAVVTLLSGAAYSKDVSHETNKLKEDGQDAVHRVGNILEGAAEKVRSGDMHAVADLCFGS